ncbi:MAG: hypothetical protein KF773_27150 [Deltaproteobacteria bacterium]|nr:hypothetical protein [Deltaproteobacteria bacterium]
MAVATYPGTVSPLRGLDPYGEAERDVWHGREKERDEIAKLVGADGFRAGLLFGEPGVGKTSLVRAGLIPYLRDHGIVALACEDLSSPAASFAQGMSAFGIQPAPQEAPTAFITRAVANAVAGQQFVFVVDDVDLVCSEERAVAELADLFSRVVSRSGGRARFLFVCASERLHVLGNLERRTGSLFPPSTRYELVRIPATEAARILDRILSFSGVAADPALAETVAQGIARGGPVLPADLQLFAQAMRDLHITSAGALAKVGGPTELEEAWLTEACKATGNERSAMRLTAELAAHGPAACNGAEIARRISVDPAYAQHAYETLEQRGVIARGDAGGQMWMLRHEVLTTRVRELTAPTRAAARRAFDLLGSKAENKARLSLGELRALRTEGIAPVTAAEVDVVKRSRNYYLMIAAGIAAVPIVILIIIWVSLSGRVYFDLETRAGGQHVVVRNGRAGLSGFFWLPGGYGGELADTGLTHAMTAPEMWKKVDAQDLGTGKGDWDELLGQIMEPRLAGLVAYATTGSDQALAELKKTTSDAEDLAGMLAQLRPIARGTPAEVALVEEAIKMEKAPAVQRAAVATAGAAAQRKSDAYTQTLLGQLASSSSEQRRVAVAAVRGLGERGRALFEQALAATSSSIAKRELEVELGGAANAATEGPKLSGLVAAMASPTESTGVKERVKAQLRAALAKDPGPVVAALIPLIGQEKNVSDAGRIWALETLFELDPIPKTEGLVDAVKAAFGSSKPEIKAKALPLYAKVDPTRAALDLTNMLEDKKLDKAMRAASVLAWGELYATNAGAAAGPIEKMLKDETQEVRAAAAVAAGKAGYKYQEQLTKMAREEYYPVRVGAAKGLAVSARSGGNAGWAVDGIGLLWREKGVLRREAAGVYRDLAKKRPGFVIAFLQAAAHMTEDTALHPIGVEGLCNAALAGSLEARRLLATSTDDPSGDVRRIVMSCVADGPDPAKNGVAIAQRMVRDGIADIRADAARVLALAAAQKGASAKLPAGLGEALVALLDDTDRTVRLIAVRAVGGLGQDAPKTATAAIAKMWAGADEGEKLAVLHAATQIGAVDMVTTAVADRSPRVRIEAVDVALRSQPSKLSEVLSAALADPDLQVRKEALERLAAQKDIDTDVRDKALALAVRDSNPELSLIALTTIARVGPVKAVTERLSRAIKSRVERERAQAAAAAIGLVDREAAATKELLEKLLGDPSHDVRAAMLPALAAAYTKTNDAEKLADILRDSETDAMRRLVAAAAFVTLARTETGRTAADGALEKVTKDGPPMARWIAKLTRGMIAGRVDGMTFLQELVP